MLSMCLPTTMSTSTSDGMVHSIQAYAKVWSPFTIDDEFIRDFLHRGVCEGDTVDRGPRPRSRKEKGTSSRCTRPVRRWWSWWEESTSCPFLS